MSVQERKINIREWELQFPKPFKSVQGRGKGFVEIPIPEELKYGEYIYIRDVHFPYQNDYLRTLTCILKRRIGHHETQRGFEIQRKDTTKGTVYFVDKMIKPTHQSKYFLNLPQIPLIPQGYGLFYRIHFRIITREELHSYDSELLDFFTSRLIEL